MAGLATLFLPSNEEYSPVASMIIVLPLFFIVSSRHLLTVQLLPPPVVPTTAQCRPNSACWATSIVVLLSDVNRPKSNNGVPALLSSLSPP
jgi:hypothetical protein